MALWYTDRSRYETGLGFCPRARYLEYHFGPSGYGIRAKAGSMPQARGIYAHEGLAYLMRLLMAPVVHASGPIEQDPTGAMHPDNIRAAVTRATDAYEKVVDARGLRNLDASDRLDTILTEQKALLTGMIWGFALEVLPWLAAELRIVSVEVEDVSVLGCTCGLGDRIGQATDHEARGCNGIAWMSRADVIGERRSAPGSYAYVEFKTTGQLGEMFESQWETKLQFQAGVIGAEDRLGVPIDQSYVIALITGRRDSTWDSETQSKSGPKIQQSVWCYGFRKPAPAPGMVEEWAPSYNYIDDQGRRRRLTKDFQKAGVWEIDPRLRGTTPAAEYWARALPSEVRRQQFSVLGPFTKQQPILDGFLRQVVSEEQGWQGKVWGMYDVLQDRAWADPAAQAELDALVPCSWSCRRYGKSHECQFADLCLRREGWETPLGFGGDGADGATYMLRRPHHTPEIAQAVARGITLPIDEGEASEDV